MSDPGVLDLDGINRAITARFRDRKWIFVADDAAAATRPVAALRAHHPEAIMVVAAMEGAGDLPTADRIAYTRTTGRTIMEGFRSFHDSVVHPSPRLKAAVDAFDPHGEARVLDMAFSRSPTLAGRRIYGWRRAEWTALEDKTLVDRLWDDAGVHRAPSAIVDVASAQTAADALEGDLGTVWVADNREGWHGGGEYTQWVQSKEDAERATAWFSNRADVVRVMPFLDGLPCSIHGVVTPKGIAVFRPVELFILRVPTESRFFYAQGANFWDPPPHVTDEMRGAARAVGEALRDRVDYVGAFGIDGVATREGFRPTELNPRRTIGHGAHYRPLGIPLDSMERMLIEGDLDLDAASLERTVLEGTEQSRYGGMMFPLAEEHREASTAFAFSGSEAVAVDESDDHDGTMAIGPSVFGSVVIVRPDPERAPIGPPMTPRVIPLLELAKRLWDIDVPAVEPAPDRSR